MLFDYDLDYANLNLREGPDLYRVGRGEQGVLLVEPYKSELLPHWRFKTRQIARDSCERLGEAFEHYRQNDDFVGIDMTRKFVQMRYTRARRYANYPGGRKYQPTGKVHDRKIDPVKADAAAIFKAKWDDIRTDEDYLRRKQAHQRQYG